MYTYNFKLNKFGIWLMRVWRLACSGAFSTQHSHVISRSSMLVKLYVNALKKEAAGTRPTSFKAPQVKSESNALSRSFVTYVRTRIIK